METNGGSKLRPDRTEVFATAGFGVGAHKASGSATLEATLRHHRNFLLSGALRGGARRARSGPLSESVNSGEIIRGSYIPFVADLVDAALRAADEKLGHDSVVLDLREFVDSFDALVLSSGRNDRQVRAIAEEIERLVDLALGVKPQHVEGWAAGEWIALDYGDVIVHVFDEAARDYYDLEHLWSAAPAFRPERLR